MEAVQQGAILGGPGPGGDIGRSRLRCSDITNDQLGISGETGHGGANLCVY